MGNWKAKPGKDSRDLMAQEYLEGKSIKQVAIDHDVSPLLVWRELQNRNIKRRRRGKPEASGPGTERSKAILRDLLDGKSNPDVAKLHGVSKQRVWKIRKRWVNNE